MLEFLRKFDNAEQQEERKENAEQQEENAEITKDVERITIENIFNDLLTHLRFLC